MRRLLLLGDIDEGNPAFVTTVEALLGAQRGALELVISSDGGRDSSSFALLASIRLAKARGCTVRTLGLGKVSSAAILPFASGVHRRLDRNARLCAHLGSVAFTEQLDYPDITSWQALCEVTEANYYELLAEVSGRPAADWRGLLADGRDHWLSPQQALEWGLADALI